MPKLIIPWSLVQVQPGPLQEQRPGLQSAGRVAALFLLSCHFGASFNQRSGRTTRLNVALLAASAQRRLLASVELSHAARMLPRYGFRFGPALFLHRFRFVARLTGNRPEDKTGMVATAQSFVGAD